VADIPNDAPRSEDGQWWWDGTNWQPVGGGVATAQASGLTPQEVASIEIDDNRPNHRQELYDGAVNEARGRLIILRDNITGSVASFQGIAYTATEELKGTSHSDLGLSIFKALIDVVIVAIPGGKEAETAVEVGKEALKGFIDVFSENVKQGREESAAGRVDEAKAELRRIAGKLSDTARDAAKAAQGRAEPLLGQSVAGLLAANPEWVHLEPTQEMYGFLSDHIGFQDTRVDDPSPTILAGLMDEFQHEFNRVSADLYFHDMSNDTDRLMHLLEKVEPVSSVPQYLAAVGADVPYWERRVRLYHQAFPGEAASEVMAWKLLTAASMYDVDEEAITGAHSVI
jgi:hypothetical protein